MIDDCHLWTMDGEFNILTMHLIVDKMLTRLEGKSLKDKIRKRLYDSFNLEHVTLELEIIT